MLIVMKRSIGFFKVICHQITSCKGISTFGQNLPVRFRRPKDISKPNVIRSSLGLDKTELSRMQLMQNLLQNHLSSNLSTVELWPSLEKEAIQNVRGVDSVNFDGIVMKILKKYKQYDKAQSFLRYLNSVRVPNDITLANFMALAAECGDDAKATETFQKINKDLLIVPAMVELVVQGLSKTGSWRDCLCLIRQLKEIHPPTWFTVAAAAFRNGDAKLGMQLVEEVLDSGFMPRNSTFTEWIEVIQCLDRIEDVIWLTKKLLVFLQITNHLLSLSNAVSLKQILLRRFSMTVSTVTMEMNGQCPLCGYELNQPKLTIEEHAELEETMRSFLHRGSDTYEQSHPKELKFFLKFLENSKPYDIVLDALNVAHVQELQSPPKLAQQLLNVVTQLCEQGYRPFVLGRKHIWFWNKRMMLQVEHQAKCFYTDDISADDTFMIYAALHGGPETRLMTSDLLRDYYYLLKDKRKQELFHRWVTSNKVFFEEENSKIVVKHHQKYGLRAQGNWEDGWHIPYEQNTPYKYHMPFWKQKLHWMCVRR